MPAVVPVGFEQAVMIGLEFSNNLVIIFTFFRRLQSLSALQTKRWNTSAPTSFRLLRTLPTMPSLGGTLLMQTNVSRDLLTVCVQPTIRHTASTCIAAGSLEREPVALDRAPAPSLASDGGSVVMAALKERIDGVEGQQLRCWLLHQRTVPAKP